MQKSFIKYTEQLLFYGSLLASLAFIAKGGYNPSIDGPAHMYNARIIQYLFSGNSFIHQFFSLNKIPIPNVTDHFFLAFLYLFFSPATSVKLLLILCVAGFAIAFRAIISLLSPGNKAFSAFAIPLAHSFLFYIGFYNFCLSLVFMLWAVCYYLKYIQGKHRYSIRTYIILFILIMLTYFTNGLAFAILGFTLSVLAIQSAHAAIKGNNRAGDNKAILKQLTVFASLWIPGLACSIIFAGMVPMHASNGEAMPFSDLLSWIVSLRPLIVYQQGEDLITKIIFGIIVLLFISRSVFYFRQKEKPKAGSGVVFLIVAGIMLVCYFVIPNGASVGMMSVRFCFYLFLFFILWLSLQQNYPFAKWIPIVAIYPLYWVLALEYHNPNLKKLNSAASEIADAGKLIKPNTIVFSINYTDNWLMNHFSDYALLQQPVINPNNYEAMVGWFPVVWSNQTRPHVYLTDSVMVGEEPGINISSSMRRGIDYIFVLGDMDKMIKENQYPRARKLIETKGRLLLKTNDSLIHLYSINNTEQ